MEKTFVNPVFLAVAVITYLFYTMRGRLTMSKWLLGLLVAILLVLFGIEFEYLVSLISAWLKDMAQCDAINAACNAKSAGILIAVAIIIFGLLILFAIFAEKIWRKTHGLRIADENEDELCHHFNKKSVEGKDCYFTRLKIINKSKTSAENCRGRLATIKDSNGSEGGNRWTNSELGWDRQVSVGPVSIGPDGDYKYLDIGWVNKGEDVFKIRTEQSSQGVDTHRPRGTYYFHIVVSANGVGNTVKQWFRVDWRGDFSNFKVKKVRGVEISVPFLRHRLDSERSIIEQNKVTRTRPR